jgi:hypothetical protein
MSGLGVSQSPAFERKESSPLSHRKEKAEHERVLLFLGASSDTALFEKHRSTICF